MHHNAHRLIVALALLSTSGIACADLHWTWDYSAQGIRASGTLTTTETQDKDGYYLITGIKGTRNGAAITALSAVGTAIPGNEGYPVDNLIREAKPHLSVHGLGYATADGNFANPFFADFHTPPAYLEFYAMHPLDTTQAAKSIELPVRFNARRIPRN